MAKAKSKTNNVELFPEEPPGHPADEAVSAWIKAMRLGDVEAAYYWMFLCLEELNVPLTRLARRLAIFGMEDIFDLETAAHLASLAMAVRFGMLDVNAVWQGCYWACKAPKFWECDEGREFERVVYDAWDEVKGGHLREMPSFAIDMHTKRGRERQKSGQPIDGRYSGDREGRAFMCEQHRRLGRLDPAEGMDALAGEAGQGNREGE